MRDAYEWWGKSVAIAALIVCLTQVNVHAAEPPGSAPMEASELFRRASPSIVVVEARVSQGISQGSGVVVGDGEIVTNHHVVDGAIGFVLIRQGPAVWRAEITHLDKDRDLAILAVILRKKGETFTLPQVRKRKAASVRVGEKAYAIGAPRGLERTLSEGLVSGLPSSKPTLPDGFVPDDPEPPQPTLIQTTAAISPGSSGGGLFDARGQLFGITTVYLKDSQNINFAVSADDVAFLQQSVPNTTKY